jgi:acyl-CoA thioesterase-1
MMKRLLCSLLFPLAVLSQPSSQPLQVSDTIRFLALGDSYTIGQSVGATERWPVQLSDSLAARNIVTDTLRIIATTGWRTDDLLSAITNQHLKLQHYNLVSLLIGVNNQYQGKPFSQYVTEFPALLDSAILYASGNPSQVFVVSIPDYAYTPFGQQSSNPSQISTELAQYNQYAKRVADSLHVHFFNITPISQQGIQNPAYVTTDGLHPSGAQYAQWIQLMLDFIDDENLVIGVPALAKNNRLIQVFPNPATDDVTITFTGEKDQQNTTADVYNMMGQLVFTQTGSGNTLQVPVAQLSAGMYTLKITSGDEQRLEKLVKLAK